MKPHAATASNRYSRGTDRKDGQLGTVLRKLVDEECEDDQVATRENVAAAADPNTMPVSTVSGRRIKSGLYQRPWVLIGAGVSLA
jgi:hypothetical protein